MMTDVLEEDFTLAPGALIEGAPEWFNILRKKGLEKFKETEWPTKKDENWRFGNPKKAKITDIPLVQDEDAVMDIEAAPADVIRFTFLNGFCVGIEGEIPEGLLALPLNRALFEESEALEALIPTEIQGKLGSGKLAAFHRASLEEGAIISIAEGVTIEKPIEIVHLFTGAGRSHAYVSVVAGKHSKASIVESFKSINEEDESTVLSVCDIVAKDGALLKYLCTQQLNEKSQLIRVAETHANEAADTTTAVLHIGSEWVRDELYSTVEGKEAQTKILSVALPKGTQQVDQRTFQHHASPHCFSDLLYKNVLHDKAKTTFSGLIFVDEKAHYTDAFQTCRNLLMSDTCEANSMPGLEINADQVKCSHGSTSAQVSEEEIFYLQARGIPADTARQMIAEGFCAAVFAKIGDDVLEQHVLTVLASAF